MKSLIWIAASNYVLVSIIKKRLGLAQKLHTLLQILSLTLFEKMPLYQAFQSYSHCTQHADLHKPLTLFDT